MELFKGVPGEWYLNGKFNLFSLVEFLPLPAYEEVWSPNISSMALLRCLLFLKLVTEVSIMCYAKFSR